MTHASRKPERDMADNQKIPPLAREVQTYEKLLPSLMKDEGKYVTIFEEEKVGVFAAYEEALRAGYERAKLSPFLVKKISGTETVAYFSRDIDHACRISL